MTENEPKHPGKILFDQVMTPLGVSRNKLARDIDVPVGRISDIVAGKRGVTPDTALRIAKYFGTSAELWLRLQADFDLNVARTTTWRDAEPKVAVFEPVNGVAPNPSPAPESIESTSAPHNQQPIGAVVVAPVDDDAEPATKLEQPTASSPAISSPPEDLPADDSDDEDIDIPDPVGIAARPEGI